MPSQGGEEGWDALSQGDRAHTGHGRHLCRMTEPKLPVEGVPREMAWYAVSELRWKGRVPVGQDRPIWGITWAGCQ